MGVESVPGRGSTFRFSIRAEVAAADTPAWQLPEQPALDGLSFLALADAGGQRDRLAGLLQRWGMRPASPAAPGPDVVCVDRGLDAGTADAVRALRACPRPPVVVVLAPVTADASARQALRAAGACAVLHKPVRPDQLHAALVGACAPAADGPAWVARPAPPERRPLRVLLAEDNVVNQKVATRLLAKLNCRVDAVADGAEAVAAVRRQRYDVVLMDVQMPEMDGLEATRRIRAAGGPQPHVIALTANAMEGDRQACLDAGADDYLPKPVAADHLAEALHRAPVYPAVRERTHDNAAL